MARKFDQDLERRKILSPNQGGHRAGNTIWENAARCLQKIPEEGTNAGRGGRCERCVQQSPIQTNGGTLYAIWRQLDAYEMACSGTSGKKGCLATVKLTIGLSQGFPLSPVLYNVYTKGLADLNSNGYSQVLTLADDGLIYKTASRAYLQNNATGLPT